MAFAADFLGRLDEEGFGLRRVVDGVARQATEMSLDVRLANLRFVTTSTTGQNHGGLHAAVAFDEFGIAGTGMFRTRAVATFASACRRILTFQRLRVSRFEEGFVDVLVTSLANFDPGVLGILVGSRCGILRERQSAHQHEG